MKWLAILLLLSTPVFGAMIEGTVYDFSLEPVRNAIVEVDTSPHQVLVAKAGQYKFSVPQGKYTIVAELEGQVVSENITVAGEGDYVLDLILLPDLAYEEELLGSVEDAEFSEIEVEDDPKSSGGLIIALAVLAVLAIALFIIKRKKKPAGLYDEPLKKILAFIEKQGGRTTQKDIYKELPWSESKISLMLDELESKGLIRKVKKGRSNLIFRQ